MWERAANEPAYVSNTGHNINSGANVMGVLRMEEGSGGDPDDEGEHDAGAVALGSGSNVAHMDGDEEFLSHHDRRLNGYSDMEVEPLSVDPGNIVLYKTKKPADKPKKKQKTTEFSDTLLTIEEKKDRRFEEELKLAKLREDRMEKMQKRQLGFQEKQLNMQADELNIRRMEAENRRLGLQLRLRSNGNAVNDQLF
ncbi:uncharacterized protein LOC129600418 [Paramacrobiotus metropolitanus]|uniref:uncharacterized protein LOC129600418 n=1 Tax=Paramacrobiotus metropolitanus TaxID=2943436 RepID=UPI0024457EF6|nr:uncharacterized protein LOC129600418 [Paramacrobiotus metropolitanus]